MSKFFQSHDSKEFAGEGKFYRLEQGENIVRILSVPVHFLSVFMGKGVAPQIMKSTKEIPEGKDATHRFMMYVWDYKAECIKQAEFGVSIINALSDLSIGEAYGFKGDLPPYDIIVMKKGEGMETRYTVTPGRNEDKMTKEVLDELASLPTSEEIKEKKYSEQNPGKPEFNPNATEEEVEEEIKNM